jgi:hypothetical protein
LIDDFDFLTAKASSLTDREGAFALRTPGQVISFIETLYAVTQSYHTRATQFHSKAHSSLLRRISTAVQHMKTTGVRRTLTACRVDRRAALSNKDSVTE